MSEDLGRYEMVENQQSQSRESLDRLYHAFVAQIDRLVVSKKIEVAKAPWLKPGTQSEPLYPAFEDGRIDFVQDTARDIVHTHEKVTTLDRSKKGQILRTLDKDPSMGDYEKLITFLHVVFNNIAFLQYYSRMSTEEKNTCLGSCS